MNTVDDLTAIVEVILKTSANVHTFAQLMRVAQVDKPQTYRSLVETLTILKHAADVALLVLQDGVPDGEVVQ